MIKLSEKQKQIVEFEEGALLVKAGPGSGKTRVLIERIKRLLKRKKRIKILALTFSNNYTMATYGGLCLAFQKATKVAVGLMMIEDFPTLLLPTKANSGIPVERMSLRFTTLVLNSAFSIFIIL